MPKFSLFLIKPGFEIIPRYYVESDKVIENQNSVFGKTITFDDNSLIDLYLSKLGYHPTRIEKDSNGEEIYFKRNDKHHPWWQKYWKIENELYLESASAIVLKNINDRLFVFTHGYGRFFINPFCLQYDFGLKAAANLIDDTEIRTARLFTPSEIGLRTTKQSGKNAKVAEFDINIYNSMLKNIAGKVKKEYQKYFKSTDGADSICFSYSGEHEGLFKIASTLLDISSGDSYKKNGLYWIDNFKPVRDELTIQNFDARLVDVINARSTDLLLLYPQYFEMINDVYFQYNGFHNKYLSSACYPTLDIEDQYYNIIGEEVFTSINEIRKQQILAVDNQFWTSICTYSVYECLYFEFVDNGIQYFFEGGMWYSIEKTFYDEIEERFENLNKEKIDFDFYYNRKIILRDARRDKKNKEYIFNGYLTKHLEQFGKALLLDTDLVNYKKSRIEICDVLYLQDGNYYMIHNKYKYGSSSLSHLFSQGNIAAECMTDREFRMKVNEKILDKDIKVAINDSIDRDKFTVVFGIIGKTNKNGVITVPVFSKINLKIFSDNLKRLGFKMKLSYFEDKI